MIKKIFLFLWVMGAQTVVFAAEIRLAVTADFSNPIRDITAQFVKQNGHKIKLSFSSAGHLYSQITKGAPFDIFLSSNIDYPEKLVEAGLGISESRFIYAIGKLALWSSKPNLVDKNGEILLSKQYHNIALGNPKNSPYGIAAVETLKKVNIFNEIKRRLVYLEHTADVFQMTSSGGADLGFVALSQLIYHLEHNQEYASEYWVVPASHYNPLNQQAILLKAGEANQAARDFLEFLKSPAALEIIHHYGYDTE